MQTILVPPHVPFGKAELEKMVTDLAAQNRAIKLIRVAETDKARLGIEKNRYYVNKEHNIWVPVGEYAGNLMIYIEDDVILTTGAQ